MNLPTAPDRKVLQACLFDVETEKFIDVLQPIELSTKQTNRVTRIYSLEKGITWILCESGYAFRVDEQLCKKGEGITLYSASNHNLKGNQIFNIYQDSEEDEWILTDKGVSIIGKKTLDTDFQMCIRDRITIIHKPGVDHHPHSLNNPEPIVQFILKATNRAENRCV